MTPKTFANWFNANAERLLASPPGAAADEIAEQISRVNPQLSVEIGDDEPRELIVSAGGNPSLFGSVTSLCKMLGGAGWDIVALKPPRGFEFELTSSRGATIDVAAFRFEPLEANKRPG